jgi:hypothetical protein
MVHQALGVGVLRSARAVERCQNVDATASMTSHRGADLRSKCLCLVEPDVDSQERGDDVLGSWDRIGERDRAEESLLLPPQFGDQSGRAREVTAELLEISGVAVLTAALAGVVASVAGIEIGTPDADKNNVCALYLAAGGATASQVREKLAARLTLLREVGDRDASPELLPKQLRVTADPADAGRVAVSGGVRVTERNDPKLRQAGVRVTGSGCSCP